jgi:DNA-binding CsgD family transcriptional regulator
MQFTTTSDGVRIAYAVVGEGPTMVIAAAPHLTHSQLSWSLFPHLYAGWRGRLRVVLFDWRNTGLSGTTGEDFSITTGLRDLEAVIGAAAPAERVTLYAGPVAPFVMLPYAVDHPDRVARLVLFCSGPRINPRPAMEAAYDLIETEPNVAVRLLGNIVVGYGNDPQADWERYYREVAPLRYQARTLQIGKELDVSGCMAQVTCPTLVVSQRGLFYPSPRDAAQFASAFPQGRLLLVEGESFLPDLDAQRQMADWVTGETAELVPATHQPRMSEPLSRRELEVLALIAGHKTNPEIAEALTIAPATASRHVHNILEKLGVSRRSEAAAWWAANGNGRANE